jgi:hypothetical protein
MRNTTQTKRMGPPPAIRRGVTWTIKTGMNLDGGEKVNAAGGRLCT